MTHVTRDCIFLNSSIHHWSFDSFYQLRAPVVFLTQMLPPNIWPPAYHCYACNAKLSTRSSAVHDDVEYCNFMFPPLCPYRHQDFCPEDRLVLQFSSPTFQVENCSYRDHKPFRRSCTISLVSENGIFRAAFLCLATIRQI